MNYIYGSPARHGPEASLVEQFLATSLPPSQKEVARSVFIEHSLGNYRPDIVVVFWDISVTESWSEARLNLNEIDLRLLHLLYLSGTLNTSELRTLFPRRLNKSLGRLVDAGILANTRSTWRLNELSTLFAVQRIVAFEAKMSAMTKAMEQAYLNTWFASESYVITSYRNVRAHTIQLAKSKGVGMWLVSRETDAEPLVAAGSRKIPQSYGSWLFNELVWKAHLGFIDEC